MPLRRNNTKTFTKKLYGGITEKIRVLKRGDDQRQGVVTAYILFGCWRSAIQKTGETLQGDMVVGHTTVWHIPLSEMKRVGINYFNPLDRVVQIVGPEKGAYWQPEATTEINQMLFGNVVNLSCLRVDPPRNT